MTRLVLTPLLFFAVSVSLGADPPASSASDESGHSSGQSSRGRGVSAELAAGLPKFAPPGSHRDRAEAPDLRLTDRPRNAIIRLPPRVAAGTSGSDNSPDAASTTVPLETGDDVVRLPNYEVRNPKLPELHEREMLTPKGRLDLGLKRHPGLKFGPFASLNNRWAIAMLDDEDQAERNTEMSDLVDLMQFSDDLKKKPKSSAQPAMQPTAPPK